MINGNKTSQEIVEIANQILEDELYLVNGNSEEPCALIAQARFWEGEDTIYRKVERSPSTRLVE